MKLCACCNSNETGPVLDFGRQPVCNRFLKSPADEEDLFPLGISACRTCGLITLTENIPAGELRPRVDWIRYHEPEGHLDNAVEQVLEITGPNCFAFSILGLSQYDASTVRRFQNRGFEHIRILDLRTDMGIEHPGAGIETLQSVMNPEWAASYLQKNPPVDLVYARYILEHAGSVETFLATVHSLIKPGGYAVFEVPDFSIALTHLDYSPLWEEHTLYFTPVTLRRLLAHHGFQVRRLINYPYPLENSLVAVCQPDETPVQPILENVDKNEFALVKNYTEKFTRRRRELHSRLAQLQQGGKIAVFGASHLAIKFINLFEISNFITLVVDDHPEKCGLYMPGSRLPIKPSSSLPDEGVKWCLLSLNPESEERVMKNLKPLFESGKITAFSIFPASPRALMPLP